MTHSHAFCHTVTERHTWSAGKLDEISAVSVIREGAHGPERLPGDFPEGLKPRHGPAMTARGWLGRGYSPLGGDRPYRPSGTICLDPVTALQVASSAPVIGRKRAAATNRGRDLAGTQ